MLRPLRVLLRKEFLQIRRDPVILRMLFLVPVIQLIVLANAATFEVKRSRLWVVDQDRTPTARGLVERFTGTGRFVRAGASVTGAPAEGALLDGGTDVILTIPADFERDIVRTGRATVQLVFNAEDGAQAGVSQSYAAQIVGDYAAEVGARLAPGVRTAAGGAGRPPERGRPRIEVQRRGWFNPSLDYRHYMVPGILVQLITIVGTAMTALNIVREKEAGTLDSLNVTPVGRATFIVAKLLPLWLIAQVQLTLGLLVATLLFGVPVEGSLALVYAAAGIYLVAALGVGLWVSAVVETQQQALFVTFAVLMVYILMSGLFTPVRAMPEWVQWVAQVNPLLHFITLMRAVLLKGAGVVEVLPQLLALAGLGLAVMTVAVRQYHKRAG